MGVLHRCLPHPAQCETHSTEVEAGVTEQQLLRTQDEAVVLEPGGLKVLGYLRDDLGNPNGVEKQLEGPPAACQYQYRLGFDVHFTVHSRESGLPTTCTFVGDP